MPSSPIEVNGLLGRQVDNDPLEPLAIVGFAFKYPQDANSQEGFWKVLSERRCLMTEWPEDRIRLDAFYYKDEAQSNQVPRYEYRAYHF